MKKRLLERLSRIRRSRANVALLIVGGLLLISSAVWAFVFAPWLKVEPTDFAQFYFYDTTITEYLSAPGSAEPVGEFRRTDAMIERRTTSRPDLSTSGVSTVEIVTRVMERESGRLIKPTTELYYIDRRSGQVLAGALSRLDPAAVTALSESDRERFLDQLGELEETGAYYVVFPFNSPEGDVEVWIPSLQKRQRARYTGSESIQGLRVNSYTTEYVNETAGRPEGFPPQFTGTELKAMLGMPDLPLADSEVVAPRYLASYKKTFLVEPKSGTVIEEKLENDSVALAFGPSDSPVVTRLLLKTQYSTNPTSVTAAVQLGKEEAAKQRLQFIYIPTGLLLLGILCVAVGCLAVPSPDPLTGPLEEPLTSPLPGAEGAGSSTSNGESGQT